MKPRASLRHFPLLLLLLPLIVCGSGQAVNVQIGGRALTLEQIPAAGPRQGTVIFLPGDGGWHGLAVSMGREISRWGYDVYGLDTKDYLESYNGARISHEQLAADVRSVAEQVAARSHQPVVLIGWSQGASMAIAAASGNLPSPSIRGILTLGLPETGVLGWDWKATMAVLAHREPDQPKFSVRPLLAELAPTPVVMIHGSRDEYTTLEQARSLYQAAGEPKRLTEIAGADHRFDGHQQELFRSLKDGLEWIANR